MGFWRKVCYVIAMVMIAGGQPMGQLPKSIDNKQKQGSERRGSINLGLGLLNE
jgi:hypothetical protein